MKDWYLRQTPRDRIIVLVVGALSLLGLFYAFVWHPMMTKIDDNQTLINSKRGTLQEMEVESAKLRLLKGTSGPAQKKSDLPPYALIDQRIRAANLGNPDRVEPRGNNGARVQFSEVEFDKLVLVLAELEQYGLSVDTLNISRNPKLEGKVSARINMEKN